ncbi:hypothetical protein PACTADRAFT_31892 [Pachysolen tannophilus NRRL Y-2460]|uniref:Methylthioribulose-1-phosphate dehydratase n=1 Tax=Pachysolen tannophilus NRRL Y-2460 TaxID=669874 RepID=A0A1E4U3D4_PACTA|nr:hypothetical protein PACTADRAFT_31892 [Pachysolen tannophilus NRRL Y-2460]
MVCNCSHSAKQDESGAAKLPESESDSLILSDDPNHPANLICELCKNFYVNGWVTGTGGGVSIRDGDKVFIAPSGVQKERMLPENIFVMSLNSKKYLREPISLKPSSCTPLFLASYDLRGSGGCIHTHSQNAVMCTLLFDDVFEISHVEQIKAIPRITEAGYLNYNDKLVIPIIENTNFEQDLEDPLKEIIKKYPGTTAVLVRRHGIYVWGETVWKAKIYNEAIDYLLELAVKMKLHGIPTVK